MIKDIAMLMAIYYGSAWYFGFWGDVLNLFVKKWDMADLEDSRKTAMFCMAILTILGIYISICVWVFRNFEVIR